MGSKNRIAIIGLGYVGLPLAIAFARQYQVIGFDTDNQRINDLKAGIDRTLEADLEEMEAVVKNDIGFLEDLGATNNIHSRFRSGLFFSQDHNHLRYCNIFIVTVPTPIDQFRSPDLRPLIAATKAIGKVLNKGDIVIYESTVYPGCTEEECVPVLEEVSGLKFNQDFFVGYSPERVNPGDKINTLAKIRKVTSGSTPEIADKVDNLYRSVIRAGTYKAPSIKVAEASKSIENAQRDLNISFVNELALIFDRLGIDTHEVLEAAATKWNFLPFKPGLVGGHCIGVDPYYLAHKAEQCGYTPNVLLSGRKVNEQMARFIAEKVVKIMTHRGIPLKGAKALLLGITFKENCPDIRNTGAIEIYRELVQFGLDVTIFDPWASPNEVLQSYGIEIERTLNHGEAYQAIIVAVAHQEFLDIDFSALKANNGIIFDTKAILNRELVDGRL